MGFFKRPSLLRRVKVKIVIDEPSATRSKILASWKYEGDYVADCVASNCLYFGVSGLINQRNFKLTFVLHSPDAKWKRRISQK